jgi:hypothetical protein
MSCWIARGSEIVSGPYWGGNDVAMVGVSVRQRQDLIGLNDAREYSACRIGDR